LGTPMSIKRRQNHPHAKTHANNALSRFLSCSVASRKSPSSLCLPEFFRVFRVFRGLLPAMPKPISLVAAVAENRVMGRAGHLPWRIPEDMRFFHTLTAGKIAVLGRICYETWPRAADDARRPIVITRDTSIANERVRVAPNVPAALALAETLPGELLVCGGQRIFEETLPLATRLHLTLVHAEVAGDRFFPEWRDGTWREVARHDSADAHWRYSFVTLERAPAALAPAR